MPQWINPRFGNRHLTVGQIRDKSIQPVRHDDLAASLSGDLFEQRQVRFETGKLSGHGLGRPACLLLADVGEGTYLYSSLVWYRQLEALNPGAWRMFANLVSLPLTDGR